MRKTGLGALRHSVSLLAASSHQSLMEASSRALDLHGAWAATTIILALGLDASTTTTTMRLST
eukprot:390969-Alexandrium_andersonii.AAC.1